MAATLITTAPMLVAYVISPEVHDPHSDDGIERMMIWRERAIESGAVSVVVGGIRQPSDGV
jgi:hypothetical protein